MSLVSMFEILPPNKDRLSNYLYTELKNQCAWRDNKSDAIQDQYKFFDSYFGKNFKNNYINKELIQDYLKESEKAHHLQLNTKIINKSKFVELDLVMSAEDDYYLYYFDNEDKNLKLINFNFNEERQLSLTDLEDFSLNFDTNIRQVIVPHSNYFKSGTDSVNRCLLMDMYSIYSIDIEKVLGEEIKINKFDKLLTLDDTPNTYMSDSFLNKFFIISHSNSTNSQNKITLIDDNFKISNSKDFNLDSANDDIKNRHYKRGVFVNHPMIALLHKDRGEIIISDFRSKENYQKKILDDNKTVISSLKMSDAFRYMLFSTKKIELYDLRFPSLKVSEFPLNINYKEMEVKNILTTDEFNTEPYYIGIDQSRKDCSHLLFKTIDDSRLEFFNDFVDVNMISQSKESIEIHDTCSILVDENNYINFTVDNFGALKGFCYDLKNSVDCTKSNVELIQNNFADQSYNGELKNIDDKIVELFETNYKNNIFKKTKNKKEILRYTQAKIKVEEEEEENVNLSDFSESDHSDEEMNFGKANVNASHQKLFKIQNKRKLVEEIVKKVNNNTEKIYDRDLDLDFNVKINIDDENLRHSAINEEMKWLFDKFDEEIKK